MKSAPKIKIAQRQPRVLIVDDESNSRELLGVMLASEGYLLFYAANGEEALAMIAAQPPDLFLLDITLAGIDGYDVTAAIKVNVVTKNIPVNMSVQAAAAQEAANV